MYVPASLWLVANRRRQELLNLPLQLGHGVLRSASNLAASNVLNDDTEQFEDSNASIQWDVIDEALDMMIIPDDISDISDCV